MVLDGLDHPLSRKNGGSYKLLTKPQYSYKQASISFLVNHGLKMLTTTVSIVLFESFGYAYSPRYLKPTIWRCFGCSRLTQNGQFGGILILELKQWVLGTPCPIVEGSNIFYALIKGQMSQFSMIGYNNRWVEPPVIPKKWR